MGALCKLFIKILKTPLFNCGKKWYAMARQRRERNSMANIFDVAKYILAKNGKMSTMKLQKLCYYAQAWSLAWDDEELFPEDFQAWANGPVCKSLFDLRKGYFAIEKNDIPSDKLSGCKLTQNQKDTIDRVIEYYGDKSGQWLSTLTHMEAPWREARGNCAEGDHCETIISKERICEYYVSL